jgi:hypothetical protein
MEDINLNVLGERLDCKPDMYEICVAINKLKDRVNTLEKTLFSTERKEKVLSCNLMRKKDTLDYLVDDILGFSEDFGLYCDSDNPERDLRNLLEMTISNYNIDSIKQCLDNTTNITISCDICGDYHDKDSVPATCENGDGL